MFIGDENYNLGNEAMAWVLLLYFHLAQEGGFSHAETVYVDAKRLNGYDFLRTKVDERHKIEIDEDLIRQGAVIFLICDLNDMISDHEDDFLSQELTKKILRSYDCGDFDSIPESKELIETIRASESKMNYEIYRGVLDKIYTKYVLGVFKKIATEKSL
ncbi:MAG: hypothetical protein K0U98_26840 [Deltaproteobacteria bacterium]|nr:hypothetical protein [Deltaproteobacteria bacterium]